VDDANSSTFGIYSMGDMLAVANDGRPFTIHDIEGSWGTQGDRQQLKDAPRRQ